jgi:predicted dehydrogenase
VGASRFASFCLEQYDRIDSLAPRSVWNRTESKAQDFARRHGLTHHADINSLLGDPKVALVHVASTPTRHAEHAVAALAGGKHVLCEKPLATTLADADRMVGTAREGNLLLIPNFVMRFGPLWRPVKTLLEAQALGSFLRGDLLNCAGDDGLPHDHWFWDERESGGIFIEHGVHFFDLLRSWLGEGRVASAHRIRRPGTDRIDQVHAEVLYGDGASVGFYHGFHQPARMERQALRLIFERGRVVLHGWLAQKLDIHALLSETQAERVAGLLEGAEFSLVRRFRPNARPSISRRPGEDVDVEVRLKWSDGLDKQTAYGNALCALMRDILDAVRDPGHRPRVRAEDGRAALNLALRADRIAREVTP